MEGSDDLYFKLPQDVIFQILFKLPTRTLLNLRGVACLFDTNYFNFVGTVILWIPFIGKHKILPCLQGFRCFRSSFSHLAVGFGFDRTNLDFKVVKILYGYHYNEHELRSEASVYGVKTGSWRGIGQVVPCFSNVFVHGVVYWMAYMRPQFVGLPNCIMGFDVVEEIFTVMKLPQNLGPNCKELRLSPLVNEKSLSLFVSNRENMGESWDAWLMDDYGKVDSWVRKYIIVLEQVFVPIKFVNDGEIIAALNDELLVLMNVETEEIRNLAVCGLPLSFYAADYHPSLALIDIGQQLVKE